MGLTRQSDCHVFKWLYKRRWDLSKEAEEGEDLLSAAPCIKLYGPCFCLVLDRYLCVGISTIWMFAMANTGVGYAIAFTQ